MSERDEINGAKAGHLPTENDQSSEKIETSTELGNVLSSISQIMAESERRQAAALSEMQERISKLSVEAQAVRGEVPAEHQGAFQRVEEAVDELASRFTDEPDQAEPEQAESDQAQPVQAEPEQAESDQAQPVQAESEEAESEQVEAVQAESEQAEADHAEPDQAEPDNQEPPQVPSELPLEAPLQAPPMTAQAAAALDQLANGFNADEEPVAEDPPAAVATAAYDPDEPWDADTAEQLTQLYERGEAGLPATADLLLGLPAEHSEQGHPEQAHSEQEDFEQGHFEGAAQEVATPEHPIAAAAPELPQDPAAIAAFDKDWLEEHFSHIAARIDEGLQRSSMHDASIESIERRFDDLEGQIQSALAQVATRSDIAGLGEIEACIVEFTAQFDRSQAELARIETVETQVRELAERLSEERLEAMAQAGAEPQHGLNAEHIAEFVARHVAERSASKVAEIVPKTSDEAKQEMGELKGLLNNLISEHRNEGKQTSDRLDTMQEAMLRLLDRIENMEGPVAAAGPTEVQHAVQPEFGAPGAHTGSPEAQLADTAVSEPALAGSSAGPASEPSAAAAPPVLQRDPAAAHAAQAEDQGEAPDAGQSASAKPGLDRQSFIAEARKAAAKANARAANPDQDDEGDLMSPAKAAAKAKSKLKTLAGIPQTSRVRLAIAAVAVIAIGLGAANLVLGLTSGPAAPKAVPAGATSSSLPAKPGAPKSSTGASQAAPDAASKTAPAAKQASDKPRATAMTSPQVLPPGITIDMSSSAVPASLVPSASDATNTQLPASAGKAQMSKNLPPALVGPLSLRLAAANGDPSAAFEVGTRFAEGKGVTQNFKEAIRWYGKSAAKGFPLAQYRLATLYERGLGTDADLARAKVWYERAARKGNVKSMHNLAVLTAGGKAGRSDYGAAARWFAAAAERGLADSQFNLAILYENGLGVTKDLRQAYQWFSLAARAGDKAADSRRQKLAKQLKAAEVEQLDTKARQWRSRSISRLANDSLYAGTQWKNKAAGAAQKG